MSLLQEIQAPLTAAQLTLYTGYAPTGAVLPYTVHRPLTVTEVNLAVNGDALSWDHQTTLYCCGGSVEASYNLGLAVMRALQGVRVAGTTLSVSMGYSGTQVEGHYESQITVQLHQGGI
jgi:hypothetical protein